MTCDSCGGTRLKLGGWMGPTPIRPYPDPCPDCSPDLTPRERQAAFVAYATEPGRFDAKGQARLLLEPEPSLPTDRASERFHNVDCVCGPRATFERLRSHGVAVCLNCGYAANVLSGQVIVNKENAYP